MAIHSPFYRELNLARVQTLLKRNYSYDTIVRVVRDETGVSMTPTKLRHYVEVNELASKQMLLSSKAMQSLEVQGDPQIS
ncbi:MULTISPECIES: hypothetical protein [Pseudomonadaceae]|uniref:hypothetical protein n=1 Tax=Pseudomonadaceae TaxID=135621 RepID=UPI0018D25D9C|nr:MULTISPECIES: hypothetical protein [Pseudomonadaceae]MBC8648348.1 hypothetical protein [Pseudomonas sp. MT4]QXY90295.1 hypothetical protein GYM54_01170 [Pseudomonas sp. MTM4]